MRCLLWSLTICLGVSLPAFAVDPQVPDGFTIEKVAGYPLLQRPIFAGFDDTGRLFVGESNGENLRRDEMLAKKPHWISCLEDTDGDGVFDKSTKFVEDITLPQGCLWYRGSLYAACPPSIWKFTDTNGDGIADQREEILTGFGFSGNACDTHGPFLSPTGRFYIVQGRHGHEFKDKEGKVYSKGKAGRIYSCRPDGSDVRVHAGGGFDNPVEVDFTEEGECIGTVNILYRDRGDCLMHWVEGGVYPREDLADAIAEFKWTGGLLGPIHNLGHVACSGIMRYRGVHFGDEFKNTWFFTEFNTHKVRYAELKRSGSTFTADVHEFLRCDDGDFHPTDVLEDADGSLLVLNTGAWFLNGCPTSRVAKPEIHGGVYRIKKIGGTMLDDPRGKQLQLAQREPVDWVSRLLDPRPAVREQSIELLGQYQEDPLAAVGVRPGFSLASGIVRGLPSEEMARNAVWALARRENGLNDLLSVAANLPLEDSLTVTQALIHAIGSRGELRNAQGLLSIAHLASTEIGSLAAETARVLGEGMSRHRRFAPLETGKGAVLQSLHDDAENRMLTLNLLAALSLQPVDQFQEQAVIVALTRGGHGEVMQTSLQEESAPVQRAALIALDQMDDSPLTREMVLPLLSSADVRLQQTALEVIARRPGWGAETLALLRTRVQEPELSVDRAQALRGFLLAQTGDAAVQGFIADVLSDRETASEVRGLMWEVLQRSTLAEWPAAWNPLLVEALRSADDRVTLPALRIITQRSLPSDVLGDELRRLTKDTERSLTIRSEAATGLGARGTPLDAAVFEQFLTALKNPATTSEDEQSVARALGNSVLTKPQLMSLTEVVQTAGPLELSSLIKAYRQSKDNEVAFVLQFALGSNEATTSLSGDEVAAIVRQYTQEMQEYWAPLLKGLGADPVAQAARLTELSPLLKEGDEKLGRAVFFGKKANCSQCHAVAGEGGRIGPHLTTIGASRSPTDLLEAIVFPSASFVNGYRPYVIVTDDGKVYQGIISAESPEAITLRTQDLQEIRIRRDAIDEMREGSVSIMPKGLDTQLTPEELRHLLAYLQSRK